MATRPDWIGIGCAKCGTSWTWREMRKHPQVFAPRIKEVSYFNSGPTKAAAWYLALFNDAEPGQKTGEFSPYYFHYHDAPHRIKAECPDAKLIVCFRHPADRAFSDWRHSVHAGRLSPGTTFADAFNLWSIRDRGIYARFLKHWYRVFPEDQIKIMWFDDMNTRPADYLMEVYRFIGVDDGFLSPDYADRFHFDYHRDDPSMTPADRRACLDFYRPHTEQLERMTGRDLAAWKS